jgi:hypothetical protein
MWAYCAEELASNRSVGSRFYPTIGAANPETMIGFLTVFPFTALQGPDNKPVSVNVFVSSDNMKVNAFNGQNLPRLRGYTQSHSEDVSAEAFSCFNINEAPLVSGKESLFHFGEQPMSLRSYLRRYFLSAYERAQVAVDEHPEWDLPIYPRILAPFGGLQADADIDMLSYLRYSFVGMKGSMRKRLRVDWNLATMQRMNVSLNGPSDSDFVATSAVANPLRFTQNGTAMFVPFTQAGVEVELPFYNPNLFVPSGTNVNTFSTANDQSLMLRAYWTYKVGVETPGATAGWISEETCMGEDFQLLRYLAATPYTTSAF